MRSCVLWGALLLPLLLLVRPTQTRSENSYDHLRYPWVVSPPPLKYPTLTPPSPSNPQQPLRPTVPRQVFPLPLNNPSNSLHPGGPSLSSYPSPPSNTLPLSFPSSPSYISPSAFPSTPRYSSPSDHASPPVYPPIGYPSAPGHLTPHYFPYSNGTQPLYYPQYYYPWQPYYPHYPYYALTPPPNPAPTTSPSSTAPITSPGPLIIAWPTGRSLKSPPLAVWPTGRTQTTRPPSVAVWPTEKASKSPHLTARPPSGPAWPTEPPVTAATIAPRLPNTPLPALQPSPTPRGPPVTSRVNAFYIWPTEKAQKRPPTTNPYDITPIKLVRPGIRHTTVAPVWPTRRHRLSTATLWSTKRPTGEGDVFPVWPTWRPQSAVQSHAALPTRPSQSHVTPPPAWPTKSKRVTTMSPTRPARRPVWSTKPWKTTPALPTRPTWRPRTITPSSTRLHRSATPDNTRGTRGHSPSPPGTQCNSLRPSDNGRLSCYHEETCTCPLPSGRYPPSSSVDPVRHGRLPAKERSGERPVQRQSQVLP